MATLTGAELSSLVNSYTVSSAKPRKIIVPDATRLAALHDITVTGTLLKKQLVRLDTSNNSRQARLAGKTGRYSIESNDGDLHFCLGDQQFNPHIACELQNAKAFVSTFNASVGQQITVSGFFRCLFEHPGFRSNDDAHVFEIHPVRAVTIGGQVSSFDVDIPDQDAIHTWAKPFNLNTQDDRITVQYDKPSDTLTFTDMDGRDENYVSVSGTASDVKANPGGAALPSFTLNSKAIGHPIKVVCLRGTSAAIQLSQLTKKNVTIIALRNIDLAQARKSKYVINLLAIDIQPA